MKKAIKLFVGITIVAVIGFSMSACDKIGGIIGGIKGIGSGENKSIGSGGSGGSVDIGSGGILTVTDIPSKYNGMYAYFATYLSDRTSITGCQNYNNDLGALVTYVKISNGKVKLPMWKTKARERYSGNDTIEKNIGLTIYDSATGDIVSSMKAGCKYKAPITFSNGSATISMSGQTFTDVPDKKR